MPQNPELGWGKCRAVKTVEKSNPDFSTVPTALGNPAKDAGFPHSPSQDGGWIMVYPEDQTRKKTRDPCRCAEPSVLDLPWSSRKVFRLSAVLPPELRKKHGKAEEKIRD
jgi:hypothetical protein